MGILGALGNFPPCPCAWLSERQRELAKAALRRQGLLGAPTALKPTPKRSDPLFLFSKSLGETGKLRRLKIRVWDLILSLFDQGHPG